MVTGTQRRVGVVAVVVVVVAAWVCVVGAVGAAGVEGEDGGTPVGDVLAFGGEVGTCRSLCAHTLWRATVCVCHCVRVPLRAGAVVICCACVTVWVWVWVHACRHLHRAVPWPCAQRAQW